MINELFASITSYAALILVRKQIVPENLIGVTISAPDFIFRDVTHLSIHLGFNRSLQHTRNCDGGPSHQYALRSTVPPVASMLHNRAANRGDDSLQGWFGERLPAMRLMYQAGPLGWDPTGSPASRPQRQVVDPARGRGGCAATAGVSVGPSHVPGCVLRLLSHLFPNDADNRY